MVWRRSRAPAKFYYETVSGEASLLRCTTTASNSAQETTVACATDFNMFMQRNWYTCVASGGRWTTYGRNSDGSRQLAVFSHVSGVLIVSPPVLLVYSGTLHVWQGYCTESDGSVQVCSQNRQWLICCSEQLIVGNCCVYGRQISHMVDTIHYEMFWNVLPFSDL